MAVRSALYTGTVMHARTDPTANVFRYPVYMTLLDLAELPELDRTLPLFGWNRRAPTSYHDRDHIDVPTLLCEHGVDLEAGGRIQVLTNLRVLGYVFNPVSFWWCYRADGTLACIVGEVSNTFGERLPYLLVPDGTTGHGSPRALAHRQAPARLAVHVDGPALHVVALRARRAAAARIDVHEAAGPTSMRRSSPGVSGSHRHRCARRSSAIR